MLGTAVYATVYATKAVLNEFPELLTSYYGRRAELRFRSGLQQS